MDRNTANVKDTSVFHDLIQSINRYVRAGERAQHEANNYISKARSELEKIRAVLEQRLDDAQRKMQDAERKLDICESTPKYDSQGKRIQPNCGSERSARKEANIQLEQAQSNYREMQRIMKAADELDRYYMAEEKKFQRLLYEKLPAGSDELKMHNRIVEEYLHTHPNQTL